jgi:protein SCO1/2
VRRSLRAPLHGLLGLAAVAAAALPGAAALAQTALPPDESKTLGRRVADAELLDENGRVLTVSSLAGKPLLVSPIFTRCLHVCPRITASLKQAVAEVGEPGQDFNVLSVSFDTRDTQEDLQRFRQRLELPEAWKLTRASSEKLLPFLDSLDFHFLSAADGSFVHPSLVVFLSPELEIAKYLYGVDYRAGDVRAALERARGGRPLREWLGPYILVVGVLGTLASAFVILITVKRTKRQGGASA